MEISTYQVKAKIDRVEDFWWGFLIGLTAAFILVWQVLNPWVQRVAIDHGCGRYDRNGQFEWVKVYRTP